MQSLISYLTTLNSSDASRGVWVDPENVDDFRVGQFIHENGGMLDSKVCIGSLDSLSFGDQSDFSAFTVVIYEVMTPHKFNFVTLRDAFFTGKVHSTLAGRIQAAIDAYNSVQAHEAASYFVHEELPSIIEEVVNPCHTVSNTSRYEAE